MFLVRGIDGVQRALLPGEFTSRKKIDAIERSAKMDPVSDDAGAHKEPPQKRTETIAKYQSVASQSDPREVRFAHEIMTSPVFTVDVMTSIQDVTGIFLERRFRHIPIISGTGEVAGIVSDRDILRYQSQNSRYNVKSSDATIETIMAREVLTAMPQTPIRDIARVMLDERIGSTPVVDSSGLLAGIITRSDIVRAIVRYGPIRMWA